MTGDATAATPVTTLATLIGGAGIVVGATVGGAWASRHRSYLPFLVCGALGLPVAALCRAAATAPVMRWAAAIGGGTGVGASPAVHPALSLRTVPAGRAVP